MRENEHKEIYQGRGKGREVCLAVIAGFYLAFSYCAGNILDRTDSLNWKDKSFYVSLLIYTLVAALFLFLFWKGIDYLASKAKRKNAKDNRRRSLVYALALFLCWLPAFLSIFPGVFAYDAYDEWLQVASGSITAHHPVIHVVFLGGLIELFYTLTGSYNVGIAVYSLVQMGLMAYSLAKVIGFMGRKGIPRYFRVITLIFYGVSPVMQLFAICATKDVLFTAAELLFFVCILELVNEQSRFLERNFFIKLSLNYSQLCRKSG